jgi:hypothetical protein
MFQFEKIGEPREVYLAIVGRETVSVMEAIEELAEEFPDVASYGTTITPGKVSLSYHGSTRTTPRGRPRKIKTSELARANRRKKIRKDEFGQRR